MGYNINKTYHDLLTKILDTGFEYKDPKRSGVHRLQIPSYRIEHDLTHSFPAIATKKLAWNSVCSELVWFLKGDSNIKYLLEHNNNIWNKDAYAHYKRVHEKAITKHYPAPENVFNDLVLKGTVSKLVPGYTYGDLGPVYGQLWRKWPINDTTYIDQIKDLVEGMIETPMSTEHIVTAWNPGVKDKQALPPCHKGFQIIMKPLTPDQIEAYVIRSGVKKSDMMQEHINLAPKYGFELVWEQRSVDTFLGLPFNIASYGLLAHILGKLTNSVPLKLVGDLRNVHLYDNSIAAANEQLTRDPNTHGITKLLMKDEFHTRCEDPAQNPSYILDIIKPDMFKLYNYNPEPGIKVEMLERN